MIASSAANASGLSLISGAVTSQALTHPCPGQVTATAATGSGTTYSAVSLTVPDGCAGDRLSLTLLNGSTVLRSGAATVSGSGATTVTSTGTYTAAATLTVLATVGGWNLPTTWSFTPPTTGCIALSGSGDPAPGGTCTITGLSFAAPWGNGGVGHRQTNGHVLVTSSRPYVSFTVDLRSALPGDWVWATSGTVRLDHYTPSAGYMCSSLPVLSGRTNANWAQLDFYVLLFENRAEASGPLNCS